MHSDSETPNAMGSRTLAGKARGAITVLRYAHYRRQAAARVGGPTVVSPSASDRDLIARALADLKQYARAKGEDWTAIDMDSIVLVRDERIRDGASS